MISRITPILFAVAIFAAPACKAPQSAMQESKIQPAVFLKQGHRGTRGLMAENTIPSMKKAILDGANTIEMDIHITKDNQVIVYHDSYPNPDYTTFADGSEIPKEEKKKYSWYQISYAEAKRFVIGMKPYPAFPQQQPVKSYAPLLGELIDSVEQFTKAQGLPPVYYNVEIKADPATDGKEQPSPEEFVALAMKVLEPKKLGKRLFIQSFDERQLQVLNKKYPHVLLGFLTGSKDSFEDNMKKLGFTPAFYNPHYSLVTKELVTKCHELKMQVNPWTLVKKEDFLKMKALSVDGIITDYPNIFKELGW